jgi:CHC2-type zinc finger protein/DNA primase-like protein
MDPQWTGVTAARVTTGLAYGFPASSPLLASPHLSIFATHHPCLGMQSILSYAGSRKETAPMLEDLARIKQQIPLRAYLQRRNWAGCRIGSRDEFVGLCPLHHDSRPSFYVNDRKNLFYCHGCQQGGDLIRFVELSEHLPFRESVACLKQDLMRAADSELLARTVAFYQLQLHHCSEAACYLRRRGLHDPNLIVELGLGYAPGGNLRRHLTDFGYSFDVLLRTGLINYQGRDAFCRRVIFPCYHQGCVIISPAGLFILLSTTIPIKRASRLPIFWPADCNAPACRAASCVCRRGRTPIAILQPARLPLISSTASSARSLYETFCVLSI